MRRRPVADRHGTRVRARGARACALLVLGVLAAATGCGVQPSDVVQAGEPATGATPAITVFFFVEDPDRPDGSSAPAGTQIPDSALRGAPRTGDPSVAAAVRAVFAGPDSAEAQVLTTRLPRLSGPPSVRTDNGFVLVGLPSGSPALSASGMRQVVCTAAAALRAQPVERRPAGGERGAAQSQGEVAAAPAPLGTGPVTVRVDGAGRKVTGTSAGCPAD